MHDAQRTMERGLARRWTNETKMNAESSRSHAVLTLHLESSTRTDSGLLAVRSSRLNLVDLAGTPVLRTLLLCGRASYPLFLVCISASCAFKSEGMAFTGASLIEK